MSCNVSIVFGSCHSKVDFQSGNTNLKCISRLREEACSGAGNKACREKMRRDRLNDRCVADVTYLQLSICKLRSYNSVYFKSDKSMKVFLILSQMQHKILVNLLTG